MNPKHSCAFVFAALICHKANAPTHPKEFAGANKNLH